MIANGLSVFLTTLALEQTTAKRFISLNNKMAKLLVNR